MKALIHLDDPLDVTPANLKVETNEVGNENRGNAQNTRATGQVRHGWSANMRHRCSGINRHVQHLQGDNDNRFHSVPTATSLKTEVHCVAEK